MRALLVVAAAPGAVKKGAVSAELIAREARRQESTLELIASENFVSKAVMEAAGSVDTLGIIARYYGVSWRYLQQVNGVANANLIYPGQKIRP